MPPLFDGTLVDAQKWNAHVDQINANTSGIANLEARTTNASTGNTALGNRVASLEALKLPGAYMGQWTDNNARTEGQTIDTNPGKKITENVVAVGTPTGCSMNGGTVTITQPGIWQINASLQYGAGTSVRAMWISKSNAASGDGLAKYGAVAGPSMDVQSSSATLRFAANEQFSVYAAVWQNGAPIRIYRALSNNVTAVWLGP